MRKLSLVLLILLSKVSFAQEAKLMLPIGHSQPVTDVSFVAGGKLAVTSTNIGYDTKVWELPSGKLLKNFTEPVAFNEDGKQFLKQYHDTIEIWDLISNKIMKRIVTGSRLSGTSFVPGINAIAGFHGDTLKIYDAVTGVLIQKTLGGDEYQFSPSGEHVLLYNEEPPCLPILKNMQTGMLINEMSALGNVKKGFLPIVKEGKFSTDSRYLIINTWQMPGKQDSKGYSLSSDGGYSVVTVWEVRTGKQVYTFDFKGYVQTCNLSMDGSLIITGEKNGTLKLWDTETGKELQKIKYNNGISVVIFSPDNKGFAAGTDDGTIITGIVENFSQTSLLKKQKERINCLSYDSEGKQLLVGSNDHTGSLWDIMNAKLKTVLKGRSVEVKTLFLSPDGVILGIVDSINYVKNKNNEIGGTVSIRLWNCRSGRIELKEVANLGSNIQFENYMYDSREYWYRGKYKNEPFFWKGRSGRFVMGALGSMRINVNPFFIDVNNKYSLMFMDSTDYLVFDKDGHYDGTEAARKSMYFVEGLNIVELDQLKDQLWVPNLAERIMKGDSINAKTLAQLDICGLTPEVEEGSGNADEYYFKITPRRGGLGETVVSINGIEVKRYKTAELIKNGIFYELFLKKAEFISYFIEGIENKVTVKAYTSDNTISSRGAVVVELKSNAPSTTPNLYAVMVGVSDYKGEELDLKYAAKDATDLSSAISNAAKKLLNTDGIEHVFMYNLTTEANRYQLPEKNSIKKVLEDIGKKANANDILLLFFAGHGVMEGESKQFYFLTADASGFANVADVGISTTELTEWMKPENIKAQKRILILDACNSGQAIKDFVKMGDEKQNYLAARNDDQSQQIKAIDKLNEKSGLFIISASASNQSAYEVGRYSQGLLTYSLLKAIKQDPEILEDGKFLNISRWFNAAEKSVSELSQEYGARQEPQIVTNTNFNIGLVDEEVISKIVLPSEKPLFSSSNFQNSDENIADDDLELSKLINLQLNDIASRGTDSKLVYVTVTNSPDAYSLSGRYTVKGNLITITVNIKQNKQIKSKFELTGTKDKLNELAISVAEKAAELAK